MSTRNQAKDWYAAFRYAIQLTFFRSRHFLDNPLGYPHIELHYD
jgi:hypothetical protein